MASKFHYWAVKFRNGRIAHWTIAYARKDAIKEYLKGFAHGSYRDMSWQQHRRKDGVTAVKVDIVEAGE